MFIKNHNRNHNRNHTRTPNPNLTQQLADASIDNRSSKIKSKITITI